MEISFLILALLFYCIGSLPFGYIFTKFFSYGDIRNIGSGNIGATNVLRTGNKFLALIVLIFDILKGFIPTFFIFNYFYYSNTNELIAYILGSIAILGHMFPFWLKFKGGKGVATYIGYLFAIDYLLGLIFVFSWLIIAIIKKYSSLASVLSLIILPFVAIILSYENTLIFLFSIISIIIIAQHYSNILRLLNKTENKIKF